jgi:hypothetical protein
MRGTEMLTGLMKSKLKDIDPWDPSAGSSITLKQTVKQFFRLLGYYEAFRWF